MAVVVTGMRMNAKVPEGSYSRVREDHVLRKAVAGLWMWGLWVLAPEGEKKRVSEFLVRWWVYLAWGEVRGADGRRVTRRA